MTTGIDLEKFKNKAKLKDRYAKQLQRLQAKGIATDSIELAVNAAVANLAKADASSLVIYGEPQSGKTEMMICLTARLLDEGHSTIIHLMNDSVDLLTQNLKRFKASGLAPGPRSLSELLQSSENQTPQELVVFCKKNSRDLDNLIGRLKSQGKVVVIDDEADYATPNAKINQGTKTKIKPELGRHDEAVLTRYIGDMRRAMREVSRVLAPGGKAVYVIGENTIRGTYIRTSHIISAIAQLCGLRIEDRRVRELPANRRYLPPPSSRSKSDSMDARMRREVVLAFAKPKVRQI
jgi:hypothetical protein